MRYKAAEKKTPRGRGLPVNAVGRGGSGELPERAADPC